MYYCLDLIPYYYFFSFPMIKGILDETQFNSVEMIKERTVKLFKKMSFTLFWTERNCA